MTSTVRSRLLLLLGCTGAGVLVGVVGQQLGGSEAWYLAVPACIAVGWAFVGDPTRCCPPADEPKDGGTTRS